MKKLKALLYRERLKISGKCYIIGYSSEKESIYVYKKEYMKDKKRQNVKSVYLYIYIIKSQKREVRLKNNIVRSP